MSAPLEIRKGLVSTIIPVYNRPELVLDAVQSVLAQTYQALEIIIVDDGSTDHTLEVLKQLKKQSSTISVLHQSNHGPGVARQTGLSRASGEFIQFLDSDDLLLPNKFTQQVTALSDSKNAVAAYGKTELIQLGSEPQGVAWKRTGEKIKHMFPLFLNERWWGTSTPLYRHRVLRRVGDFLPLINEEDWEYDCRVATKEGGKLVYVDEFVSIQRRHDQSHLSDKGGSDKTKLAHRCQARKAIYDSATRSKLRFSSRHKKQFSKATFLLARECAAQGMSAQVLDLLRISIKANGGPTEQHKRFIKIGKFFGWRVAAWSALIWQRVRK